jgi:outer membrane protein assembly factor BamA
VIAELTLALWTLQVLQVPQVRQSQAQQVLQVRQGYAQRVLQVQQVPQLREVISEVLVHGNQIVPDAEVRSLAGIVVGSPFTDAMLAEVTKRLKESGKFESIDVVKRFASIEDASRIIVVIIVSEGPVRIVMPGDPNGQVETKKRSFIRNLMFVPLVEGSDGYGLTAGARIAYPKPFGTGSRLSFPVSWGGTKRLGVELEQTFKRGPISRVEVGGGLLRRRNPAFDQDDDRLRLWARAFRMMGPVRVGGTATAQQVTFGGVVDQFTSAGADVMLDTRDNPTLPRNAVLATASAEVLFFDSGQTVTRTRLDGTGYIGLFGQHVLIVHALREDAGSSQPPYLRSILGGWWTLRGFETGFMSGDTLVSGSLEWRAPISSPLRIGKLGVSAFMDWGTAYDHGQSLRDQPIYRGYGGTVWFAIASARMAMAVARGVGAGTRVHFSGSVGF